jgi:hypothetical protein
LICRCDVRSVVICNSGILQSNRHPLAVHFMIDIQYHSHNITHHNIWIRSSACHVFQFGKEGTWDSSNILGFNAAMPIPFSD